MKTLLSVLAVCLVFSFCHGMNEKQVKSAGKLVRNACQPKTKVTDELIDAMHKGVWDEEPTSKCYMNCVLVMFKVALKDGLLDLEAVLKQVPNLPEKYHVGTEAVMKMCKEKVTAAGDKCENSWQTAKCIYMGNPADYFLP